MNSPNSQLRTLNSEERILEVKDLQIHFFTDRGVIRAVEGVDFTVRKGEVWGLVGESASGKSVIGQALVGVVAKPAGHIISGEIFFKGEDILKKSPKRSREDPRKSDCLHSPGSNNGFESSSTDRVSDRGGLQVPSWS